MGVEFRFDNLLFAIRLRAQRQQAYDRVIDQVGEGRKVEPALKYTAGAVKRPDQADVFYLRDRLAANWRADIDRRRHALEDRAQRRGEDNVAQNGVEIVLAACQRWIVERDAARQRPVDDEIR